MPHKITAQIFKPGRHNGLDFDTSDLDIIASSFDKLKLAGKLPLKRGHAPASGSPADGWVEDIWIENGSLWADLTGVPDSTFEQIKAGQYRNVSIELLRDFEGFPWVLDGVAILGAERPAVDGMQPLDEAKAVSYTRAGHDGYYFAANFALRPDAIDEAELRRCIEMDVAAGIVEPRARDKFYRLHGAAASMALWAAFKQEFNRSMSNKPTSVRGTSSGPGVHMQSETTCERFAALTQSIVEEFSEKGRDITYAEAHKIAAKREPELFRAYVAREDAVFKV